MTVLDEAQDKLFETFPRRRGENLKGWFPRVARELNAMARNAGWTGVHITPRRVRALWNHEARRIDAVEMRLFELAERLVRLEQAAEKRRETLNDIHDELEALRSPVGGAGSIRDSRPAARDGGAGDGTGEGGGARREPAEQGEAVETAPVLKFSPRLH